MRETGQLRPMVVSAVMTALALVLPVAFHSVGLGSQFLPMLLPLLLNAFLVPFSWAVGVALVVPWVSALFTGMPPIYPPVAAIVSMQAAVMAGFASILWRQGGRKLWFALIPAVIAGRLTTLVLTWLLARLFSLPPALSAGAQTLEGLPGAALQLAVIPIVLRALRSRRSPLFGEGAL